jgi:hypothetical protein
MSVQTLMHALHYFLLAHPILASMTNHTIDDAGPLVRYIPFTEGLCVGCAPVQYNRSELNNGTITTYPTNADALAAVEMNFTGAVERRAACSS